MKLDRTMGSWTRRAGTTMLARRQPDLDPETYRFINETLGLDFEASGIDDREALINDLLLNKVVAVRQMNIILGAIGMFCSFLTILRIINDAKRASANQVSLRPKRFQSLLNIHPAETFPFVLAKNIVISLCCFIGVQSTGLNDLDVTGCSRIAQLAFPAVFLIGYTTLAFGFETALRGLNTKKAFKERGRSNSIFCVVAIVFLTIATWIPTAVKRAPDHCLGSLAFFVEPYSTVAVAIIVSLIASYALLALAITIRLKTAVDVCPRERVSASWMVYYLYATMVLYIFALPFFVDGFARSAYAKFTAARVADVPLFSAGMILAFIHAFLRSNATRLLFMPAGMSPWAEGEKPRIRLFGNSDLDPKITGPLISKPEGSELIFLDPERSIQPKESDAAFLVAEKQRKLEAESPKSSEESDRRKLFTEVNYSKPRQYSRKSVRSSILDPSTWRFSNRKSSAAVDPSMWPLPPHDQNSQEGESGKAKKGHRRNKSSKSNYTLFPTRVENLSRLPSTAQGRERRMTVASAFEPVSPYPISTPKTPGVHRRDSSVNSSATVQIGLRLSLAPQPTLPSAAYQPPLPQHTYEPPPPLPQSTYQPPSRHSSQPRRPGLPLRQDSLRKDLPLRQASARDELTHRQSLPVGQDLPIQLEAFTPRTASLAQPEDPQPPLPAEPRTNRQPTLSSLIREERLDKHSVPYMRRASDFDDAVELPQPLNVPSRQNSPRPSTADSGSGNGNGDNPSGIGIATTTASPALNFGFTFPHAGTPAPPTPQTTAQPAGAVPLQTLLPATTYSPPLSLRNNTPTTMGSKRPESPVLKSPTSSISTASTRTSTASTIAPLPDFPRPYQHATLSRTAPLPTPPPATLPPPPSRPPSTSAFPLPDYPPRASLLIDPTAPLPSPRPVRSSSAPMSPAVFSGLRMNPATEFIAGPASPQRLPPPPLRSPTDPQAAVRTETATALTIGAVVGGPSVVTVSGGSGSAGSSPDREESQRQVAVARSASERVGAGGSRLGLGLGTMNRGPAPPRPGWI